MTSWPMPGRITWTASPRPLGASRPICRRRAERSLTPRRRPRARPSALETPARRHGGLDPLSEDSRGRRHGCVADAVRGARDPLALAGPDRGRRRNEQSGRRRLDAQIGPRPAIHPGFNVERGRALADDAQWRVPLPACRARRHQLFLRELSRILIFVSWVPSRSQSRRRPMPGSSARRPRSRHRSPRDPSGLEGSCRCSFLGPARCRVHRCSVGKPRGGGPHRSALSSTVLPPAPPAANCHPKLPRSDFPSSALGQIVLLEPLNPRPLPDSPCFRPPRQ